MSSATDETWRDPKVLHRWFAVSSVLLLLVTIWMFVDDHQREWKAIQRKANRIDSRMAEWRQLQLQTEEQQAEQQKLERLTRGETSESRDPNGFLRMFGNILDRLNHREVMAIVATINRGQ